MITDASNNNFQLATDFINYTNQSVFLTGKAGTGKTTFLKFIRKNCIKQMAIVAPTGVAAINAGGVTIHSFFQLPFNPFVPEGSANYFNNINALDKHQLLGRLRITSDRRKIFQQLELLIIDEISMVRADVLDAIDIVLKHFRNRNAEPFGGVQVLLIGDMFQLPPVAKEDEWQILSTYYATPYFFSSRVMQNNKPAYIELTKIYRQQDEKFISLLNKIRNNEMDEDSFYELHENYQPDFVPYKKDNFITLTTHNYKADAINNDELNKLKGKIFSFEAEVRQEFNEKNYPAEITLQLKIGAQVMFIKNDLDKAKKYYNGKIGIIKTIDDDKILVECKDDDEPIEVKKYVWENIRYTLNPTTQRIEEEVIGSFTQYPLRLAWAITIHKSQGLTFEKAIIDAGQSFAAGQVYVALSRCTNLKGVVLKSKIFANSLKTDEQINDFTNQQQTATLNESLVVAKKQYQQNILLQLFNCTNAQKQAATVVRMITENNAAFNNNSENFVQALEQKIISLNEVSKKFQTQIIQLCNDDVSIDNNTMLQDRIIKAANYFQQQLQNIISHIQTSSIVSDSKQYSKAYNEELQHLFEIISQQQHIIQGCLQGFSIDNYHQQKNNFTLPHFAVDAYAFKNKLIKINSPHPELYKQLKLLRDTLAEKNHLPIYLIINSTGLDDMARYLPQNISELKKCSGFGDVKIEKYGWQFLDIIQRYCNEHHLSSLIHEKPTKKERKEKILKPDTKKESYNLFKDGKTIEEIAKQRSLSTQTIEGHLAHFVSIGELNILELMTDEKIKLIEPYLQNFEKGKSLTTIKEQVGENISYNDLRLVLAYKQFSKIKV